MQDIWYVTHVKSSKGVKTHRLRATALGTSHKFRQSAQVPEWHVVLAKLSEVLCAGLRFLSAPGTSSWLSPPQTKENVDREKGTHAVWKRVKLWRGLWGRNSTMLPAKTRKLTVPFQKVASEMPPLTCDSPHVKMAVTCLSTSRRVTP